MATNRKKLKLYVWEEFCPDYSDGLAFAIATSEKEAWDLVTQKNGWEPSNPGPAREYPIKPCAFLVYGGS